MACPQTCKTTVDLADDLGPRLSPAATPQPLSRQTCYCAWLPSSCPSGSSWPSLLPDTLFFLPNLPFVSQSHKLSQKGLAYEWWNGLLTSWNKASLLFSQALSHILVVERLTALWLVMSYSTSLRRHVMYYYRLSHELSAKGFLKFEFSKTRMPNSNKHGALLPGAFAILLGHPGNYYFQIFWIYSCLHVQPFQRGRILQNSWLVQLIVLFVSSWWCCECWIFEGAYRMQRLTGAE